MGSNPQRNNQIYENGGKLNINYSILVNGLMTEGVGNGDDDRSPDSKRIIFCFTEKGDPFWAFQNIFTKFEDDIAKALITEVGRVAEFICDCMQRMQLNQKDGERLWTDNVRDAGFAAELRNRLYLGEDSPMRAEMVALCCMKITGEIPRNFEHFDEKNPEEIGYNRSGTFNVTVTDSAGDLYLLQVIVASRRYSKTTGLNGLK